MADDGSSGSGSSGSGSSGSKVPGVVIWIGLLVFANILSQVFHWGIIIY